MAGHGRGVRCALLSAALLAGCDDFPKDISGTTEAILRSGAMRAGIVASDRSGEENALATRLADSLDVAAEVSESSTEDLVRGLEEGEIDIVIGSFAKDTPWADRAAITGPARAIDPPADHPALRALVRPGENRWLIHVERTIRADPA